MILNHQSFNLFGKPLFTWVTLETPTQDPLPLPSEACFAYIMTGENQAFDAEGKYRAEAGKAILSLCGRAVGNIIASQEKGQVSSMVVHFHRDILLQIFENAPPPYWQELEKPVVTYLVQMAASELVKQYISGITYLFRHRAAVNEEMLILKLKEIILLLLQTANSPEISQIMNSLFSQRTFSFKEVIDAHICEPVSVKDLAMLTNHSLSSFKREFKKIYKSTPGAYIIEKRAEKVAGLLAVSDESISSIGYDCGFTSPAHLSRVFKSRYGLTPSEYRLNLSGKP